MTDYRDLETELAVARAGQILCVLKVGWREHLQELERGRLRFRRLGYYGDLESKGKAHYDENEGLVAVFQSDRMRMLVKAGDQEIEISSETGLLDQILVRENRERMVLCLHAVRSNRWRKLEFTDDDLPGVTQDLQVPDSMAKFGDHAWVIKNGDAFRSRLRAAVQRMGWGLVARSVQYVDFTKTHGRVQPELRGLVKSDEYAAEREYRIMLDPGEALPDPFYLDVGDLTDISVVVPLSALRISLAFD